MPRAPPPIEAVHSQNKNFYACLQEGGYSLMFSAFLNEIFYLLLFFSNSSAVFHLGFSEKGIFTGAQNTG